MRVILDDLSDTSDEEMDIPLVLLGLPQIAINPPRADEIALREDYGNSAVPTQNYADDDDIYFEALIDGICDTNVDVSIWLLLIT